MLARMDHVLLTAPNRLHGAYDRRHLDEIRPRPHDVYEVPHRKLWFDARASMGSPVVEGYNSGPPNPFRLPRYPRPHGMSRIASRPSDALSPAEVVDTGAIGRR